MPKIASTQVKGISATRVNSGTATSQSDLRIEYGWGAMTLGSNSQTTQEVVAFNSPFTEIPIVLISMGGDQVSGAEALGTGQNTVHGLATAKVTAVSINGFNAYVWSTGTWSTGNVVYYHWVAIGK